MCFVNFKLRVSLLALVGCSAIRHWFVVLSRRGAHSLFLTLHALLAAFRSDDATVRLWNIDGCVERSSVVLDHVSSDARDVQGVSALEWDVRALLPCLARSLVLHHDLFAAYWSVPCHRHAAWNCAYLGCCRLDAAVVDVSTPCAHALILLCR